MKKIRNLKIKIQFENIKYKINKKKNKPLNLENLSRWLQLHLSFQVLNVFHLKRSLLLLKRLVYQLLLTFYVLFGCLLKRFEFKIFKKKYKKEKSKKFFKDVFFDYFFSKNFWEPWELLFLTTPLMVLWSLVNDLNILRSDSS